MEVKNENNSTKKVVFQDFFDKGKTNEQVEKTDIDIEELSSIELELKVLLGETELTISDILNLKEGDTIEVDRLTGELLDIYIGKQKIAKGEVVVLEPTDVEFSTIISEVIVPQRELLKKIKKNGELE